MNLVSLLFWTRLIVLTGAVLAQRRRLLILKDDGRHPVSPIFKMIYFLSFSFSNLISEVRWRGGLAGSAYRFSRPLELPGSCPAPRRD